MSIRKVVAGLLITAGIAIMAVPFFWRTTGEKQTEQLIREFEQTLEDDYDEDVYKRQGRGSGTESDSDAIPLESDDTELNGELDKISSLGVSKEAEYLSRIHI